MTRKPKDSPPAAPASEPAPSPPHLPSSGGAYVIVDGQFVREGATPETPVETTLEGASE